MRYISTRGGAPPVDFTTACLAGLAPDGGLYVPENWPQIAPVRPGEAYADVAARIVGAFAGDALTRDDISAMCEAAYATFDHQAVTPLVQAGPALWLLELHHGPTLAFKDVAMQFLARLYDHALSERGDKLSIVCATSGDTGGAAANAFAGAAHASLFILHPDERVSPVQRRFMTTTGAGNVHNLAIDGDFDDCQAIVKSLFADRTFAACVNLSGVNSINWARITAQTVYYAMVQAALGTDRPIRFVVPSGNMGDSFAGYAAARCGLLAGFEAVCAVNENRALADIFATGQMRRNAAVATPSPAMDISVPSNFERLLFEITGRDSSEVRQVYDTYAQSGEAQLSRQAYGALGCTGFSAVSVTNEETMEEMSRFYTETGWMICPHTAVGTHAARGLPETESATIVLATAHAAKFPETAEAATGRQLPVPEHCRTTLRRDEDYTRMAADTEAVRAFIRDLS